MRWIALILLFTGCSATRVTKISLTRVHGEPCVSVEFSERGAK